MQHRLRIAGISLAIIVAALVAAVAGLRIARDGVLPGVAVDGNDVGGLSIDEATAALAEVASERESEAVVLTHGNEVFRLAPRTVDFTWDVDATLARALEPGREGNVFAASWDHVEAFWTDVDVTPITSLDNEKLNDWVATVAAAVDEAPFPGAVSADPSTLAVSSTPPGPGARVDQSATLSAIRAALSTPGEEQLELPVEVVPPRIEDGEVEELADKARAALSQPLTLTADGAEVTFEPAQVTPFISLLEIGDEQEGFAVQLQAPLEAVEEAFADVADRFHVDPVDAEFDIPREPPVTFDDKNDATWQPVAVDVGVVPSKLGRTFDPDLAAAQISQMLNEGVTTADIRLTPVEPAFTTEDAQDFGLTHLISTFTTYHACCGNRVRNIQRLADIIDGTLVPPGEQFSINDISGERTCSKGFVADKMILNNKLVDVCGGGVSQFGTTTLNAAFFAAVPIDEYKAHSWYISRYPMGREATLNLPSPNIDVKFTNDTDHGMLVRTSYTGTSITVSIYGNNGERKVQAIHGSPDNFRAFGTTYEENKALPPGTEVVTQGGKSGFDVNVWRVITHADGEEVRERFFTRYVPIPQIVERNSDPAPPPPEQPPPDQQPPPQEQPPPAEGGGESTAEPAREASEYPQEPPHN